jgi:hypothetical protein
MSAFHIQPKALAKEPHEKDLLEKSPQKLYRKKANDSHKQLNVQLAPQRPVSNLHPEENRLADSPP